MGLAGVTRESVAKAIEEHDDLGEESFLLRYGVEPARSSLLVHRGRRYEPHAIVAAAHRYAFGHPLPPDALTVERASVIRVLMELGFEVQWPQAATPTVSAPRLLISPSYGSAESRQHWKDTLDQTVPFAEEKYSRYLTEGQHRQLLTLHPEGHSRFWGATPGHDAKMAAVATGDVVLFTGKNHVRAVGEVGVIFRNREFADALWPPKEGGESWHTVYSLRQFETTELPYAALNALLGYKSNFAYPGQLVLSGEQAAAGINGLLITTRTALERAGAMALPGDVRMMQVEQQHTYTVTVEQSARQLLFNRAEAELVTAFCNTLTGVRANRFATAAGICDLYLDGSDGRELIEAKSRVERPHVRAALAQLLDYARYAPAPVDRLSALFPAPLASNAVGLLHHYGIDSIHRTAEGTFQRLPAPEPRRRFIRDLVGFGSH
ncbi:hypothetical protein [Streptomyces sp. PSKA30]|uniref:hypothetical protein n=1 Tax=Streptomyces sp. PSKA30 TaxID=2874597 RepID=UPI001CD09B6A|nr:hypothetical protein [Streptomyces sp. PSKA30]MBZ9642942.1 hypothetical protein [Streptomyces sp. PSKA30]